MKNIFKCFGLVCVTFVFAFVSSRAFAITVLSNNVNVVELTGDFSVIAQNRKALVLNHYLPIKDNESFLSFNLKTKITQHSFAGAFYSAWVDPQDRYDRVAYLFLEDNNAGKIMFGKSFSPVHENVFYMTDKFLSGHLDNAARILFKQSNNDNFIAPKDSIHYSLNVTENMNLSTQFQGEDENRETSLRRKQFVNSSLSYKSTYVSSALSYAYVKSANIGSPAMLYSHIVSLGLDFKYKGLDAAVTSSYYNNIDALFDSYVATSAFLGYNLDERVKAYAGYQYLFNKDTRFVDQSFASVGVSYTAYNALSLALEIAKDLRSNERISKSAINSVSNSTSKIIIKYTF